MPKIVNLGSLCVDHVYEVPALARSGETIASVAHRVFAGGKGLNQSLAAALASAEVQHAGAVGDDGEFLIAQLADAQVDTSLVIQLPGSSGHAVIQVDPSGQNAIVIAGGSNRELPQELFTQVVARLAPQDWLLLQNEINDIPKVLSLAASAGAQVAINIAPVDGREVHYDLTQVALVIVNEIEIRPLVSDNSTPEAALRELAQRLPNTDILLTLGKQGLLCATRDVDQDRCILSLPAHKVQPVDETAAGDAFIGYLLAALSAGSTMKEALQRASAAGALAVTRAGAAPSLPQLEEVSDFMLGNPALTFRQVPFEA